MQGSRKQRVATSAATGLALAFLLSACAEIDPARTRCLAGLWRTASGDAAALNAREDGSIRLTRFDGKVWTLALDGNVWRGGEGQLPSNGGASLNDANCSQGRLDLTVRGEKSELARVRLDEREIRFASSGAALMGKLVVAPQTPPEALVVLLHGSEKRSAIASNPLQYLLAAQGIATFVFDKRGTGASEGDFTQAFPQLARDAAAAFDTARRTLARDVPAGFFGGSQGAWVAPLAAAQLQGPSRPAFVIAAYGLAHSPMIEDREEVFDDLRRAGFGDEATLAKAREITDATAVVMRSNFTRGFDRLEALKEKYGKEPWFAVIDGEFTGDFLGMSSWWLSFIGPLIGDTTPWDYDPAPVIKGLGIPMLWVLAADDTEAPGATTLKILRDMQAGGARAIDIAVFPDTEHGIAIFREKNRERTLVGHAPGYFPLLSEWIRTRRMVSDPAIQTFPGATAPVY